MPKGSKESLEGPREIPPPRGRNKDNDTVYEIAPQDGSSGRAMRAENKPTVAPSPERRPIRPGDTVYESPVQRLSSKEVAAMRKREEAPDFQELKERGIFNPQRSGCMSEEDRQRLKDEYGWTDGHLDDLEQRFRLEVQVKSFERRRNELLEEQFVREADDQRKQEEDLRNVKDTSRRSFLRSAGFWLSGVAAGAMGGFSAGLFTPERRELDERNALKKLEGMLDDLGRAPEKETISFAERDQQRARFLEKYHAQFADLLQIYLETDASLDDVESMFLLLTQVDCQGLLFQAFEQGITLNSPTSNNLALQIEQRLGKKDAFPSIADGKKQGRPVLEKILTEYWQRPAYYAIRATDYLPTSKTIHPHEIDPRWNAFFRNGEVRTLSSGTEKKQDLKSLQHVMKKFEEEGGWTGTEESARFLVYLDNQEVRDHLQDSDCTLTEAYSIIKAAVHFETRHKESGLSMTEIVVLLLDQREAFRKKKILSDRTEFFVTINYTDKKGEEEFNPEKLVALADAAGVLPDRRADISTQGRNVEKRVLNAIAETRGETCIFFNTHGLKETLSLNEEKSLSYQQIATALIGRMQETNNVQTLGEVNIVIAACNSYHFTRNLLDELRRQYGRTSFAKKTSWQEVYLPTIIAQTQESELGWGMLLKTFLGYTQAIKEEKGLTGEMLLRGIQPVVYPYSDMTFFLGLEGQSLEFARYDSEERDRDESVSV